MANTSTSEMHPLSDREIFYFRQRQKNKVFQSVIAYFAEQAEARGLTKRDIAKLLNRDPAQITRWLSGPSNWTLDTISDLLLAMKAELEINIVAFDDDSVGDDNILIFDKPATTDSLPQSQRGMVAYRW